MPRQNSIPGAWSTQRIVETLTLKCARAAMCGRPTPVAAAVLARLENAHV